MLNKIKITGKFISSSNNKDEKTEQKEKLTNYFSLLVPTPSNSITIIRFVAQQDIAENLSKEIQNDEVITIKGYLQNEKLGRQILVKVTEFNKLDINFENLDINKSNQVRLLGKVITNSGQQQIKTNDATTFSFKLLVPQQNNERDIYFCRISSKLISKVPELSKGVIVLIEGFLQTKKVTNKFIENDTEKGTQTNNFYNASNIERISSIVCYAIVILDHSDPNKEFMPLNELKFVAQAVEKIDFTKPKEKIFLE